MFLAHHNSLSSLFLRLCITKALLSRAQRHLDKLLSASLIWLGLGRQITRPFISLPRSLYLYCKTDGLYEQRRPLPNSIALLTSLTWVILLTPYQNSLSFSTPFPLSLHDEDNA
jgi:hypothetical protein